MDYNVAGMDYVAADVEGTLTAGSMWRGIGRYLAETGRRGAYQRLVARTLPGILAMRLGLIERQSYKNRWLEMEAGLLTGYTPDDMAALAEWIVEKELWPLRRPEVVAELIAHQAAGRVIVLASGMYEIVLQTLARRFEAGRVETAGTVLAYRDGHFEGRFVGPVCVAEEKARRVSRLLSDGTAASLAGPAATKETDPMSAPPTVTRNRLLMAYGDTSSDIPLLELAQEAVAVAPDTGLRRVAAARNWRILSG